MEGVVNIHGKDYKTVALRVAEFREEQPSWTIDTMIVEATSDLVLMRAEIRDEEGRLIGAGHAEEVRSNGRINKTSAVENCETSAIGRALSACGFAGSEYASANEVEGAKAQASEGRTVVTKQDVMAALKKRGLEQDAKHIVGYWLDDLADVEKFEDSPNAARQKLIDEIERGVHDRDETPEEDNDAESE